MQVDFGVRTLGGSSANPKAKAYSGSNPGRATQEFNTKHRSLSPQTTTTAVAVHLSIVVNRQAKPVVPLRRERAVAALRQEQVATVAVRREPVAVALRQERVAVALRPEPAVVVSRPEEAVFERRRG